MQRRRRTGSSAGGALAVFFFTSWSFLGCGSSAGHVAVDHDPEGAPHASGVPENDAGNLTTDDAESVAVVPAAPTFSGLVPLDPAHRAIGPITVTVDGRVAFVASRGGGAIPRDSVVVVNRDGTFAWESDALTGVGEQLLIPGIANGPGGDVYVARTNYHEGAYEGLVTRLSRSGKVRWTEPVAPSSAGSPSVVVIDSLAVDPAGNAYVVGSSRHSLPHEVTDNEEKGFVARFTPDGTLDWTARVPARSVASHPSGDIYLTTERLHESTLAKYDSMGAEIWSKPLSSTLFDLPEGRWNSVHARYISIPADGTRIFVTAELDDTDGLPHQPIRPAVLAEFDRDGTLTRSTTLTEWGVEAFSLQELVASPFGSRAFLGALPTEATRIWAVEGRGVIWRRSASGPEFRGARFFAVDVEGNLVVAGLDGDAAGSGWSLGRLSGSTGSLL
jgi:hypothetical protein